MKPYTVILNTDYGFYTYRVNADSRAVAEMTAEKNFKTSYANEDGKSAVSVVAVFDGHIQQSRS